MSKYDDARLMKRHEESEFQWAYNVVFDDKQLSQCGCGYFVQRMELIRQTLRHMPLYELTDAEVRAKYQSVMGEMFLCLLDGADLIEHGSSIGGSWITEKGERLLKVLEDEDYWLLLIGD